MKEELSWDNFSDEDDTEIISSTETEPSELPKACSITDGDCEACQ